MAGWPCLDFVNTVFKRASASPTDQLDSYEMLLAWSERVGTVPATAARQLVRSGRLRRDESLAALAEAIALRQAIAGLALASIHGRTPSQDDLDRLNRHVVRNVGAPLSHRHGQLEAGWPFGPDLLDSPLVPLAVSAATLLTSAARHRMRICVSDDGCGWLFVDETRRGTRRWCDMRTCGNRAKARRYYARAKEA